MKKTCWFLVGLFLIMVVFEAGYAQDGTFDKLLTELRVDIKYIKSGIEELKKTSKDLGDELLLLDKRVTEVEHQADKLEDSMHRITTLNTWFFGIFGTMVGFLFITNYHTKFKGGA